MSRWIKLVPYDGKHFHELVEIFVEKNFREMLSSVAKNALKYAEKTFAISNKTSKLTKL